jgi:hypothetical protein
MNKGSVEKLFEEQGLSRKDADLRRPKEGRGIPVSTTVGEGEEAEKLEDMIYPELPFSLGDAVLAFGEKEVFERFINAYVVFMQGQKRSEMKSKGAARPKTRAGYLETLDM